MLQLDPCLEIAKSAAFLAGAYIKDQQNKDLEILLNEGRDIKLQIDVDAEKIIKDHLSRPRRAVRWDSRGSTGPTCCAWPAWAQRWRGSPMARCWPATSARRTSPATWPAWASATTPSRASSGRCSG